MHVYSYTQASELASINKIGYIHVATGLPYDSVDIKVRACVYISYMGVH